MHRLAVSVVVLMSEYSTSSRAHTGSRFTWPFTSGLGALQSATWLPANHPDCWCSWWSFCPGRAEISGFLWPKSLILESGSDTGRWNPPVSDDDLDSRSQIGFWEVRCPFAATPVASVRSAFVSGGPPEDWFALTGPTLVFAVFPGLSRVWLRVCAAHCGVIHSAHGVSEVLCMRITPSGSWGCQSGPFKYEWWKRNMV